MIIRHSLAFTRRLHHVEPRMSTQFYSSQALPQVSEVRNSQGKLFKTDFHNEKFEKFYKAQAVCSDAEFPQLMSACRSGLPSVFRVVKTKPNYQRIIDKLKSGYLSALGARNVGWYGEDLVWRLDNTRWDLVDTDNAEVRRLHRWIVDQDRLGNIYRQEQVSMVPVRCLDIASDSVVLDMCASPGSKTGQVLEALHSGLSTDQVPGGCVIACEPNLHRCNNLYGNMAEFRSPCLLVAHHPGQAFPDLTWSNGATVQYDHIVCDVPCSGDGTIRKNPNIWLDWHPARGNGRFNLQLNIARRGVELLKEGGTMAYSSCSINQIENEAVIAQLLREAAGSLELVDMRGHFPGLQWYPGLSQWRVFDNRDHEYQDMSQVPEDMLTQIRPEMFAPSVSEANSFQLDRCMRFLPHLNDDGGFFVAILKKTGHIKPNPLYKHRTERKLAAKSKPDNLKPKLEHFVGSVDNFEFLSENKDYEQEVLKSLDYLGIDLNSDNLYKSRNCNNNVRMVSDSVGQLMHPGNTDLNVGGNPGVKIMRRSNLSCKARVPFHPRNSTFHRFNFDTSSRIVTGEKEDIISILNNPEDVIPLSNLSESLNTQLQSLEPGWIKFTFGAHHANISCLGYFSRNKFLLYLGPKEKAHCKFLLDLE